MLIGVVGKYVEYEDSYKSLKEALVHAALNYNLKLNLQWVEAEGLETKDKNDRSYEQQLTGFDGILVPGGFGKRGIAGMLNGIRFAREHNVPYFGICLGMQTACIEFARNVCGLDEANSSEFDPATPASRHLQAARAARRRGTRRHHAPRRLGLQNRPRLQRLQGLRQNRNQRAPPPPLRVQPRVRAAFNRCRLRITGTSPDGTYVEIVELPNHPYFLGCQFHPEFKSKPLEPHPLFLSFVHASYQHRARRLAQADPAETTSTSVPRAQANTNSKTVYGPTFAAPPLRGKGGKPSFPRVLVETPSRTFARITSPQIGDRMTPLDLNVLCDPVTRAPLNSAPSLSSQLVQIFHQGRYSTLRSRS